MGSERELKLRIKSVEGIGQLTKAMKMVASSQLRKVESRSRAAKPYTTKLKTVVGELATQASDSGHPLLTPRPQAEGPSARVAIVVISSDSGLCGAYNSNIFKFVENDLKKEKLVPRKFIALGKKAIRYFKKRDYKIDYEIEDWHPDYKLGKEVCEWCVQWYMEDVVDEVFIYYTEAITMVKCEPRRLRLLPLSAEKFKEEGPGSASETENLICNQEEYIFEPSIAEALGTIIPSYMRIIMQQVLLESKTSELGSRLTAMSNATDNADELARKLTLEYYTIRQNNITTEIIEIASGAEALA